MTLKIKVYSDYVCPFCFLGKAVLMDAVEGKDVEIEWMPFELCPSPSPKLDPINDPYKLRGWETTILPMAKQLGVEMKLAKFSPYPYTDLAFEGYHFANEFGKGNEYNNAVFEALFHNEQNIGEIEVLAEIALKVGLDKVSFSEALKTRKYKDVQKKALNHAYEEAQIRSVPTFIIGDERIQGVARKELFDEIIGNEIRKLEEK
jgi:predicted DsbA family dithiol-disulfide isomerase